ncbi:hyaluronan synthase [Frankineae bacterium MT45]|nr:hyaluronan synthase [Frankineae bacterium MT45]
MFIGLLQIRHSLETHSRLYLFSIFVMLTWIIWVIKVVLSRRYHPWVEPHETTTSVVIPVVDEPLDLFREVLERIVAQKPDQILVVINGPRNENLQNVCEEFGRAVEWTWTPIAGKRNAVMVGVERCVGEIVMLVDSDTVWTEGTHDELIKPFADPGIGGVTTRQRILDPRRSFLTRWADWLENSRALYSMPAQSVIGSVGCLPGRTIAFRRSILERVMHDFMHQRFLGVFLEVSDDRTLTNLTLKQGFRTVYQSTSLVYTDAPLKLKKLVKQQYRWARGSQYNTLRMLPWMLGHAPLLAFFFVSDIAMPFLWLSSAIAWAIRTVNHQGDNLYDGMLHGAGHPIVGIILLTVLTSTLAMCLRQLRHIGEVPSDLLWMPLYILFSTVVLMPIRIYGFFRCGHVGGWGTRADAYTGSSEETPADLAAIQELEIALHEPSATGHPGGPADTGRPTSVANPNRINASQVTSVGALLAPARPDPATAPRPTPPPSHQSIDGDPRALIPYLIAATALLAGVIYDVLPV